MATILLIVAGVVSGAIVLLAALNLIIFLWEKLPTKRKKRWDIEQAAHALARARFSERWRDPEIRRTSISETHSALCPRHDIPNRFDAECNSACLGSNPNRYSIRLHYAQKVGMELEQITAKYTKDQMRYFEECFQESVKTLHDRERTVDRLEQFARSVEKDEERRTEALRELRGT